VLNTIQYVATLAVALSGIALTAVTPPVPATPDNFNVPTAYRIEYVYTGLEQVDDSTPITPTPTPEPIPTQAPRRAVAAVSTPVRIPTPEPVVQAHRLASGSLYDLVAAYFGAEADRAYRVMMCESGGNPAIVNATNGAHFGLWQFSLPTWYAVGGTGNPIHASADEQTMRAKMLRDRAGWGQWECR
jgi:hypothetical protein